MSNEPNPKRHVLVVEDDEAVRQLLVRALGLTYEVSESVDGIEAMERLKRAPVPDIVLLDVMMPRMNGYAVARHMKADPALRNVPIVFLTARTEARDVISGINAGARYYLSKPFQVRDVIAKIDKLLKRK